MAMVADAIGVLHHTPVPDSDLSCSSGGVFGCVYGLLPPGPAVSCLQSSKHLLTLCLSASRKWRELYVKGSDSCLSRKKLKRYLHRKPVDYIGTKIELLSKFSCATPNDKGNKMTSKRAWRQKKKRLHSNESIFRKLVQVKTQWKKILLNVQPTKLSKVT